MTHVALLSFTIHDRGAGYHFQYSVVSASGFISPFGHTDDCPYWAWLHAEVGHFRDAFSVTDYDRILFKNFADAVAFKLRWHGVKAEKTPL